MLQGVPESKPKKEKKEKTRSPTRKSPPKFDPEETNPMKRVSAPEMPTEWNFSLNQGKLEQESGD